MTKIVKYDNFKAKLRNTEFDTRKQVVSARCTECAWAAPTLNLLVYLSTESFPYSSPNFKSVTAVSNKIFSKIHKNDYHSQNLRSSN